MVNLFRDLGYDENSPEIIAARRAAAHDDDCESCELCDETKMDLDPMEKYIAHWKEPSAEDRARVRQLLEGKADHE